MKRWTWMAALAVVGAMACGDDGGSDDGSGGSSGSTGGSTSTATSESTSEGTGTSQSTTSDGSTTADSASDSTSDSGNTDSAGSTGSTGGASSMIIAVTFNTGGHADGETDTAQLYGNGLAWIPAVEQTQAWLADLQPDIIAFQEIFHSPECADIPEESREGYVCETWTEGDPTVVQTILGEGYQIACNLGKPDKCAAVKTSFGSFVGCDSDFCLDGLDGAEVEDCGNGSRVGRGLIERTSGGTITLVNFHGSSGVLPADQLCRVAQLNQAFVDLDGEPAANGEVNLVLGDFNTDPARATLLDLSAARLADLVDGGPFEFITEVGTNVTPTYAGVFNIDHQISDTFVGQCWHPGITEGHPAVVDFDYFDHVPAVCELSLP